MKQEIAQLWTDALRSGDYEQATGRLVEVDPANGKAIGYCCLGVLCELAIKAGVSVEKSEPRLCSEESGDEFYGGISYDGNDATLPGSVMRWADITYNDGSAAKKWGEDGDYAYADFPDSLAGLNDNGMSFREIANLIEKYTEVL